MKSFHIILISLLLLFFLSSVNSGGTSVGYSHSSSGSGSNTKTGRSSSSVSKKGSKSSKDDGKKGSKETSKTGKDKKGSKTASKSGKKDKKGSKNASKAGKKDKKGKKGSGKTSKVGKKKTKGSKSKKAQTNKSKVGKKKKSASSKDRKGKKNGKPSSSPGEKDSKTKKVKKGPITQDGNETEGKDNALKEQNKLISDALQKAIEEKEKNQQEFLKLAREQEQTNQNQQRELLQKFKKEREERRRKREKEKEERRRAREQRKKEREERKKQRKFDTQKELVMRKQEELINAMNSVSSDFKPFLKREFKKIGSDDFQEVKQQQRKFSETIRKTNEIDRKQKSLKSKVSKVSQQSIQSKFRHELKRVIKLVSEHSFKQAKKVQSHIEERIEKTVWMLHEVTSLKKKYGSSVFKDERTKRLIEKAEQLVVRGQIEEFTRIFNTIHEVIIEKQFEEKEDKKYSRKEASLFQPSVLMNRIEKNFINESSSSLLEKIPNLPPVSNSMQRKIKYLNRSSRNKLDKKLFKAKNVFRHDTKSKIQQLTREMETERKRVLEKVPPKKKNKIRRKFIKYEQARINNFIKEQAKKEKKALEIIVKSIAKPSSKITTKFIVLSTLQPATTTTATATSTSTFQIHKTIGGMKDYPPQYPLPICKPGNFVSCLPEKKPNIPPPGITSTTNIYELQITQGLHLGRKQRNGCKNGFRLSFKTLSMTNEDGQLFEKTRTECVPEKEEDNDAEYDLISSSNSYKDNFEDNNTTTATATATATATITQTAPTSTLTKTLEYEPETFFSVTPTPQTILVVEQLTSSILMTNTLTLTSSSLTDNFVMPQEIFITKTLNQVQFTPTPVTMMIIEEVSSSVLIPGPSTTIATPDFIFNTQTVSLNVTQAAITVYPLPTATPERIVVLEQSVITTFATVTSTGIPQLQQQQPSAFYPYDNSGNGGNDPNFFFNGQTQQQQQQVLIETVSVGIERFNTATLTVLSELHSTTLFTNTQFVDVPTEKVSTITNPIAIPLTVTATASIESKVKEEKNESNTSAESTTSSSDTSSSSSTDSTITPATLLQSSFTTTTHQTLSTVLLTTVEGSSTAIPTFTLITTTALVSSDGNNNNTTTSPEVVKTITLDGCNHLIVSTPTRNPGTNTNTNGNEHGNNSISNGNGATATMTIYNCSTWMPTNSLLSQTPTTTTASSTTFLTLTNSTTEIVIRSIPPVPLLPSSTFLTFDPTESSTRIIIVPSTMPSSAIQSLPCTIKEECEIQTLLRNLPMNENEKYEAENYQSNNAFDNSHNNNWLFTPTATVKIARTNNGFSPLPCLTCNNFSNEFNLATTTNTEDKSNSAPTVTLKLKKHPTNMMI